MRFQKGVGYPGPRRPRGPGRGDPPYRMSQAAYQARLRNLGRFKRARTHGETRLIELEIALASHDHESCRGIARRLGLRSHAYCWRVIRRYRTGQIPSLPSDEESLLAMRNSLGLGENQVETVLAEPARTNIGPALENGGVGTCSSGEPPVMTVDERIAETWREVREWKSKHPIKRPHVVFRVPIR
jgi:hypothetical protein